MLRDKYESEISQILESYPFDQARAAVMPLLYLAQREYGVLNQEAVAEVAALLELETTEVAKLIGFYTLYHDEPGGEFRIQICTDLPCALRGAESFSADLCAELGIKAGQTTADGAITVEEVMCLAACDRAPMFQVQEREGIHYHEHQTVESAMALIHELRQGAHDE